MRSCIRSVIFLLSFLLLWGFPVELVGINLRMSLLAQAQEERSQERKAEALRLNNEGLQLSYIAQFRAELEKIYQEREAEGLRLNKEGLQLLNIGNFPEALEQFEQALKIFRELGDREIEGIILYNLGLVYYNLSQYEQALDYYQQALNINKELGVTSRTSFLIINGIGAVYDSLGKYQKALSYYQQSLKISQEVGDRSSESSILSNIGWVYKSLGKYQKALDYFQAALNITKELDNRSSEGSILSNIGKVYDSLGKYQKALDYFQKALNINKELGERSVEGATLNNIGAVYDSLDQYQQALSYYQQSLEITKEINHRSGEGAIFNNIGEVYSSLGQYQQALSYYQQSLNISTEIGDQLMESTVLNNIGGIYNSLGQYQQALSYYQQSLNISTKIVARSQKGKILNSIGSIYNSLGQYHQALDYFQQALNINKELGERSVEGKILNNIGAVYNSLGQYQQALSYYQQSLNIWTEMGVPSQKATIFNNIGLVYNSLGQYQQALDSLQQALKISQEIGDRSSEAYILSNIGGNYNSLGQYQEALKQYQEALNISQEIGERPSEAYILHGIGIIYQSLDKYQLALDYLNQALKIFREVNQSDSEAKNLSNIALLLKKQNQPELAIVLLKQSVNTTESIRQDLRQLPQDLQKSYEDTIANNYRALADLLIEQDRILEAQRVLDLLKLQEIEEFNRRGIRGNEDTRTGIELLSLETEIWKGYEQIFNDNNATQLGTELTNLRIIPATERTPTQKERIKELENLEQKLVQQLTEYLESNPVTEKVATLSQKAKEQSLDLKYLEILQDKLGQLDQNGILLYPAVFDDRIELVITTLEKPPIRRTVNVTRIQLNHAISEFRQALNPQARKDWKKDPTIPGQKLYNWLIKPIEQDLIDANVQTIIYAPDRQLRYIPLAALHDGQQWLIERWRVNNITALSLTNLNQLPSQKPQVLAGATSISHTVEKDYLPEPYRFNELPFAKIEVERIKSMIPNTKVLINQDFNPTNTVPQMSKYQIVHFATHGKFVFGSPEFSFILFGNGDIATLRDMEDWELKDVELVVLSACETALVEGGGAEILGLGYAIQKAGSRAAIATLWEVQDESTETLMTTFYELLNNNPDLTTAEALRQAQISLIESENNHPYYWSPFLLIGNGL